LERAIDRVSDPQLAKTDVALVGAGIMSATLGALLRQVEPNWSITLVERLDAAAAESSDPWNNAGTGHAGYCELNYTPQRTDGSIDTSRAVRVNEQFQITRQFWAYAVESGWLPDPRTFLNPIPHASFVHGAADVDLLKRRHEALVGHPLFATMEFIADRDEFAWRLPLMAAKRDFSEPIALGWAAGGTDVDFGALTRQLIGHAAQCGMTTLFGHEVRDLHRNHDGRWTLSIVNRRTGERRKLSARFVFVGAGGGAVPLLQKSGVPEAKGLGGFPVSGAFLRTDRTELTAAHHAKVYTRPASGAPPLAGTHLDVRVINGKSWLLFGPFAGWSPKFLKHGKATDLAFSIRPNNAASMVKVGLTHLALVKYLLGQLLSSESDRVRALREFAPSANDSDWELEVAGQRVNVIRRAGVLEFGTTVVSSADGGIAGLLGASPGASTAVPVMLDVMKRCFADRYPSWMPTLKEMVPSLGVELAGEPALFDEVWSWTSKVLKLDQAANVTVAAR
jgi:malate dehydrogenase (quinone)